MLFSVLSLVLILFFLCCNFVKFRWVVLLLVVGVLVGLEGIVGVWRLFILRGRFIFCFEFRIGWELREVFFGCVILLSFS